jgi:glycolate oxidase FAD binding subunit
MTHDSDIATQLADAVRQAAARKTPLAIRGSGSKHFYTGEPKGTPLDVTGHRGIVSYEPSELVITARAGTTLAEIEAALAEKNQMLAFEPPYFGDSATLGGTIACGFSGPRRPYAGSARDFVLGTRIVNGRGEILRFGGQVMKNVAGYDLSRLMVGSLGTLGVLLEISLKVLPRPAAEVTLAFDCTAADAIRRTNVWAGQPLPLSAAAHAGHGLHVRLSGSAAAVRAARARLGGDEVAPGTQFWRNLNEHRLPFFRESGVLWRLSLPAATPPLALAGEWLIDWGGAQRWLRSDMPAEAIALAARGAGGHARCFRAANHATPPPLSATLRQLHERLCTAFDPHRIFTGAMAA